MNGFSFSENNLVRLNMNEMVDLVHCVTLYLYRFHLKEEEIYLENNYSISLNYYSQF